MQTPRNRDALVATVKQGASRGLRAVGSRTSKSPCFETLGSTIDLQAFSSLQRVGPNRVRVGAGVILKDLLAFLRSEQLALPTIGEWAGQTVAGVMSTGTHGGSYKFGSVCTSVVKVVLIDGSGVERSFECGDEGFDYVLPSFGSTGVLVEFELSCQPTFNLSLGRRCISFDEYVSDLIENPQHVEFRSAIWLPAAAQVIDYSASRVASTGGYEIARELRFNDKAMVLDWVSRQPAKWSRRAPSSALASMAHVSRSLSRPLSLIFPDKHYVGSYEDMLAPLRGTAEQILQKRRRNRTPPEGEFAVSCQVASEFLALLDRMFRREGLAPDRPIGLRPGIQEHGALSATQDGPSIWVSMFVSPDNPLMKVLPDILVQFKARPHWGKCVFHRPEDISQLYPRWQEFCAFRNEMDPKGLFINPFAADFGISRST